MNEKCRLNKENLESGCSMEEWTYDPKETEVLEGLKDQEVNIGLLSMIVVTAKSHLTRGRYVLKTSQNHM
jgi:hypothetical protein